MWLYLLVGALSLALLIMGYLLWRTRRRLDRFGRIIQSQAGKIDTLTHPTK